MAQAFCPKELFFLFFPGRQVVPPTLGWDDPKKEKKKEKCLIGKNQPPIGFKECAVCICIDYVILPRICPYEFWDLVKVFFFFLAFQQPSSSHYKAGNNCAIMF
jgi:hypothetical protein